MLNMLPLFIVGPLFGVFVILMLRVFLKEKAAEVTGDVLATLITLGLLVLALLLFGKTGIYEIGLWKIPYGLNFYLDGLSWIFLLIINLVGFAAVLFYINYMSVYTYKPQFYALVLLLLAGMNGVVLSGDFFNMYVFIEISAIASYALVAYGTESEELEAAFKYMVLGGIGSAFILVGVVLIYMQFGVLNMITVATALHRAAEINFLTVGTAILFLTGFAIKAALVPFHAWLPDAHPSAPAPVSALLSGVVVKALGIYAILRVIGVVLNVLALVKIFLIFGIASLVVGSIMMYSQKDIKRMMAYSTISNMGLIAIALSLGTGFGIFAALLHIVYHSIMKSLLFLNSGAIYYRMHTRDMSKLGGVRQFMPVTTATGFVGSMAISGMPPFNGFFSKFFIIYACVRAGQLSLAVLALAGSLLTLVGFMRYMKNAIFKEKADIGAGLKKKGDVPFFMKVSMLFLAVLCIVSVVLFVPQVKHMVFSESVNLLLNPDNYWKLVVK